ncbi:hypothetical protein [uncultured Streptomyces sp.]|uniref:hypothetical protein n=1 Tax=uncultured Streptomyces sp. TaxID=174707 RepID=UPI0026318704|nr:hypothetical protein [uncultured Streptomyces sp.]
MNATVVGAVLLCRAEPGTVRPVARLLRERMLLVPAGRDWSALVPEGTPWHDPAGEPAPPQAEPAEPVDRVVTGWATALAVGSSWPVVALWWDGDRAGCTLAAGFRRPVSYVWLADGTPAGEDDALTALAARLGLDPVLDVQALEKLARPDPQADAVARLRGLLAVLARTGFTPPDGLEPGAPAARLRDATRTPAGSEHVTGAGWREAVREDPGGVVEATRLGPWMVGPRARAVATAQVALGAPLTVWGAARRSGGWTTAGAVLLAQGVIGLGYNRYRAGTAPR